MRLDFNVLWVDDQPERVAAQGRRIASEMAVEGFEFCSTPCQSIDEVRKHVATEIFRDEVDLILVDWDLGGEVKGQQAISEIRASIQYKDVIFYSAMTSTDSLRELAFKAGLEGIFCVSRGELVDEVMGVFEALVKKVLDLDHTRGIVMGATSDIDHLVHQCLITIHEKSDEPRRQAMLKESLERIDERIADLTRRAKKLQTAKDMTELFEAHMIFTANDRLRILSRALEGEMFREHDGPRQAVGTYMKKVVPDRNILGHQVLVPKGKPRAVTDNRGNAISLEDMRELRRTILNLRSEFRNLLGALRPPI